MKRILITGANGFVGSHLVEACREAGYEVLAGVRKGSDVSKLNSKVTSTIELNYSDKKVLENQLSTIEVNYVIHAAGVTVAKSQEDYYKGNVVPTANLLLTLGVQSCEKFVFISTLAARGPGIDAKNQPISEYGKSKLEAEGLVEKSTLPFSIIRPTGVYGPRDKAFLPLFKWARKGIIFQLGRSNRRLSFIHVKDLCRISISALADTKKMTTAFDGRIYTLGETNEIIKAVVGRKRYLVLRIPSPIFSVIMNLMNVVISGIFKRDWSYPPEKVKELIAEDWSVEKSAEMEDCLDLKTGFKDTFDYWVENGDIV